MKSQAEKTWRVCGGHQHNTRKGVRCISGWSWRQICQTKSPMRSLLIISISAGNAIGTVQIYFMTRVLIANTRFSLAINNDWRKLLNRFVLQSGHVEHTHVTHITHNADYSWYARLKPLCIFQITGCIRLNLPQVSLLCMTWLMLHTTLFENTATLM